MCEWVGEHGEVPFLQIKRSNAERAPHNGVRELADFAAIFDWLTDKSTYNCSSLPHFV